MGAHLDVSDEGAVTTECGIHHESVNSTAENITNNNDSSIVEVTTTPGGEKCCANCKVAHPMTGNVGRGTYCTEGTQGFWESMIAMVTLGVVSNMHCMCGDCDCYI